MRSLSIRENEAVRKNGKNKTSSDKCESFFSLNVLQVTFNWFRNSLSLTPMPPWDPHEKTRFRHGYSSYLERLAGQILNDLGKINHKN